MHKLIYDGILGIDILNAINAKINVHDNTIVCNYKNVQYEINLNSEEEECKVSETPITLYKPYIQYGPTRHVNAADEGMTKQEEEKLHELIEEYSDVSVSYTHLDVYKRQVSPLAIFVVTGLSPFIC